RFAQAVADERVRVRSTLELMSHVGRTCEARGIPYLFPKAFQDYPDFGDDVDLLVLRRSTRVDTAIVAGLPTVPVARDLGERFAGTATYRIRGCSSPLDVQHGRLGIVGEHDEFPRVLVQHARPIVVDGIAFAEPPPEDQLVLQGLQRVPGRLRIALSDVVFTISTLRRPTLDWDYVIVTARRYGALPGLGCYLGYVDQIHRDVFARPLLSDTVARALTLEGWGRIAFRDGGYRFPIVRANGRLYWGQLRHRIASGDWGGAGRLFLIPLVAGARAGRRLTGGTPPPAPRGAGPRRAAVGEGRTIHRSPRAPMNTDRILVLDGRTIEALACVRSLGRAGYWVAVGGKRRWPLASWSRYCHASYHYPEETLDGFASLRRWAQQHNVRVVLPLTEATTQLCNAERGEWEALGITLGCAPDAVLSRAFDKAETLRRAAACGVQIPPTRFPTSLAECREAAEALGYPCVVKPRFTSAWNGHGFLPDLGPTYAKDVAELEAAVRSRRQGEYWPIIQAFVPGKGKGVFTVCDHGRPIAWFAHERLRDVRPSGSGSSLRRSVALDPRLQTRAERLLAQMEWHGPAMVEFRDEGTGAPWLMEVNGRFWGSLQLSVAAGRDFPRIWTEILTGKPPDPPASYREGVILRWLWGDVKRLLYILAGRPAGYPGTYPTVAQGLRELFGRQPPGTKLEVWDPQDPWPAVGEWAEGAREVFIKALRSR
ncbi:MAG: hypothetical protein DMD67_01175, partial [Gemmatimonadetes bacterium]